MIKSFANLARLSRLAPRCFFAKKKKGGEEKDEYEKQLKTEEDI